MKTFLLAICVVLSTTASALASSSPEEMYRGQVDTPSIVSDLWTAPAGSSDTVAVRRYADGSPSGNSDAYRSGSNNVPSSG
jgi:hypothetical protein